MVLVYLNVLVFGFYVENDVVITYAIVVDDSYKVLRDEAVAFEMVLPI